MILESDNLEERVSVMQRVLEIMMVLQVCYVLVFVCCQNVLSSLFFYSEVYLMVGGGGEENEDAEGKMKWGKF